GPAAGGPGPGARARRGPGREPGHHLLPRRPHQDRPRADREAHGRHAGPHRQDRSPGGRRSFHRPYRPGRAGCHHRPRSADRRSPGCRGRPRSPRAANPPGPRRKEPAHQPRRERAGPPGRDRWRRRGRHRAQSRAVSTITAAAPTGARRHLLYVDEWSRSELEALLDEAANLRDRRASGLLGEARHLLAGHTVGLAFYEASTRTRVSFELAARELGATVVDLSVAGSSVAKGESLVDTMLTLERTGVGTVVIRHSAAGAPYLVARATGLRVLNAGDGAHAHPTQGVLDALTLREALGGSLEDRTIAIVGDVGHSR